MRTVTLVSRIRRVAQAAYRRKCDNMKVVSYNYDGKAFNPGNLQAEYDTACEKMIPRNCINSNRIRKLATASNRD